MMKRAELISDITLVEEGLPGDLVRELTYPSIFRECPGLVFPALVRIDDDTTEQTREIHIVNYPDSDPFSRKQPPESFVTYGKYFQWNAEGGRGRGFADAVRDLTGAGELEVAPDLVLTRYDALSASGPVRLSGQRDKAAVSVYAKAKAEIEAQWDATRRADNTLVEPFVSGLRDGARLIEAAGRDAISFAPLDRALVEAGIDALLVTSPHNVELFTGLSYETIRQHDVCCLYRPGADDIVVMAARAFRRADFAPAGNYPDLTDVVKTSVPSGRLGVEEAHAGIGLVTDLRDAGLTVSGAVGLLRRWQETRAITDLTYYIVAANSVLKGFERARDWFAGQKQASERDLEAVFQQGVADFAASVGFAGRLRPYFSIVHSGERTLLPATAGDYPARASDDTIKFDMGVLVYDAAGCVRACSDIARTICRTPQLQAAHDALQKALIDTLIPAMKPGMSGAQVHALGVEALRTCEAELVAADLMPEGVSFEGYSRDCGHILHRTTTATIFFLPGVTARLAPAMLGCVEFVWPLGERVLAVEDGYLVTDTDVICFTA